ncbi:MAG: hypothetical protein IT178_18115 [Acidobacteria bacterium]|nr:hypothetical protein [Acidobacteriota bacterium]
MKKLLAGCLVIVVLGVIGLGVAAYFGYRAFRPAVDNAVSLGDRVRAMTELDREVANRATYDPPADGRFTADQVKRFLAVHERVRTAMGPKWDDLRSRTQAIEQQTGNGGRDLTLSDIPRVLSDLGTLIVDARRAHVDALNAESFSSSEYAWVRLRAYQAAGLEVARGIDWSAAGDMLERATGRTDITVPAVPLPEVPAENRELVKPHMTALRDWLPLTVMGF